MISAVRLFLVLFAVSLFVAGTSVAEDQPTADEVQPPGEPDQPDPSTADTDTSDRQDSFELSPEVRKILSPLFVAIKEAKVSRTTIEVLSDSLMTGQTIESTESTYQIASQSPNKFTIYLKEPSRRTRIYNDGESIAVALAPDAYLRLADVISNQQAMFELPIPMGPYPEPVMALSLAGVDPARSLVDGMKSIEIVGEKLFRGKVPAVHLHGVQADTVTWDLWLTKDEVPIPLRLLVDLTPMLLASKELELPKGYSHQLRFDFVTWRVTGEVDDKLFSFQPAGNAKEYESISQYDQAMATAAAQPPLLAKPLPEFEAMMLGGEKIKSSDFADRIVVLDFWTTWHPPCAEILPAIKQVCDKFADKRVVFLALNVGEQEAQIKEFLQDQELEIPVVIDSDGKLAAQFKVEALPQTIVVGSDGSVESVHLGYPGQSQLIDRLTEELEILSIGGRIATAQPPPNDDADAEKSGDPTP